MRWLALLALVVLAACGGDDEGASGGGGLRVEVSFDEPLHVGSVAWEVTVVNDGDEDVELTFPNGQRAEVTLSQGGDELYRWSLERMFTQQLGEETVPAGGERRFVLEDQLEVEPGAYELTATVTAQGGPPLTTSRPVTVEPRRR